MVKNGRPWTYVTVVAYRFVAKLAVVVDDKEATAFISFEVLDYIVCLVPDLRLYSSGNIEGLVFTGHSSHLQPTYEES